jgi:alpha-L-fucosidase
LKIDLYHSLIDWHHPEFPVDGFHPQRDDLAFREASQQRDMRKYVEYLHGQVRELLTGYGQIDILWLDFSYPSMEWGWSKGKGSQDWQGQRLVEMVRELQLLVRWDKKPENYLAFLHLACGLIAFRAAGLFG